MGAPAPKKSKREVQALIKAGRRPERTVSICMRADLQAEVQEVERQIMELEKAPAGAESLAGDPRARELSARHDLLRAQMIEHSVEFRLRGLSRRRWTELVAQYPPGKDNEADQMLGIAMDDFTEALVRQCTVEPELDDEDWDHLLGEVLTDGTYTLLGSAAWGVNKRDVNIPFSPAASQLRQTSDSE